MIQGKNKTPVEPHCNHKQRKARNKAMAKEEELLVLNCAIWMMLRERKLEEKEMVETGRNRLKQVK